MGKRVYLKNRDAAIVIGEKSLTGHIPNLPDDADVPWNVIKATAILVLLKTEDEDFEKLIEEKIGEIFYHGER